MPQIQIREALRQAMVEEMRKDPSIFLIGEEVAQSIDDSGLDIAGSKPTEKRFSASRRPSSCSKRRPELRDSFELTRQSSCT